MTTRRGPKPLYDAQLANDVLGGLEIGLTAEDAIAATGVSRSTVERWRKGLSGAPDEFGELYARARLVGVRRRVRRLAQLADEGDVRAIEAWLDRCAPDYRKTEKHDHTHDHTGTVRHEHAALAAAARKVAEEEGLDYDEVQAEADAIVSGAQR